MRYKDELRRGVLRRLDELETRPSDITSKEIQELRTWFLDCLDQLDFPPPFQLCHHHLAAGDILYDPETGRTTFIDCAALQFSRAARDVAHIRCMA